jgi:hypothetical protein
MEQLTNRLRGDEQSAFKMIINDSSFSCGHPAPQAVSCLRTLKGYFE